MLWCLCGGEVCRRGHSGFLYEKLRDRILDEVDELLASLPYASPDFGQIDRAASSNAAESAGFPGSYNSKSRSMERCEILHRKERLHVRPDRRPDSRGQGAGLRKDGRLYPPTAAQIKAAAAKHWKIEQGCPDHRDLEQAPGAPQEGRDRKRRQRAPERYIYTLYASLLPSLLGLDGVGHDRDLQRRLHPSPEPLRPEAGHGVDGQAQPERTLTNAKIIETLGITPAEQAALHFYAAGSDRRES
jgi:hypothetical protein